MIKNYKIMKLTFAILLLLITSKTFSATDFDDNVVDNPVVAPIDNYIIIVMLLGLLFAFYKIKTVVAKKLL